MARYEIGRREFLNMVACAVALPNAGEFLRAWFAAGHAHGQQSGWQPAEPTLLANYSPQFFEPMDFDALRAVTEILIPTDETPGAREAHCAHFIDFILQASPEGPQTRWRDAMRALKNAGFHDADQPHRLALVDAMSKPERDSGRDTSGVLRVPVDQGAEHVCVLHVPRRDDRDARLQGQLVQRQLSSMRARRTQADLTEKTRC